MPGPVETQLEPLLSCVPQIPHVPPKSFTDLLQPGHPKGLGVPRGVTHPMALGREWGG